jgi:hypothetical protein
MSPKQPYQKTVKDMEPGKMTTVDHDKNEDTGSSREQTPDPPIQHVNQNGNRSLTLAEFIELLENEGNRVERVRFHYYYYHQFLF